MNHEVSNYGFLPFKYLLFDFHALVVNVLAIPPVGSVPLELDRSVFRSNDLTICTSAHGCTSQGLGNACYANERHVGLRRNHELDGDHRQMAGRQFTSALYPITTIRYRELSPGVQDVSAECRIPKSTLFAA